MNPVILIVFGVVLPWLLVGVGCWLVAQLVAQNGRILHRLEALEDKLDGLASASASATAPAAEPEPQGLAVGTRAPDFELPDLAGKKRSLAEFRGRQVLLVFFGPRCGYCVEMLPRLAALSAAPADGRPAPLVVSSGTPEENRKLFRSHGVGVPVLVQKRLEVASKYEAFGTPVGYLVDESGAIASPLAVGSAALLALAEPGAATAAPSAPSAANGAGRGNRPLATSRLVRDGLKAGTPAPGFRLPRVGGGELDLADYRGRRVLLVFSDPECGPCDALAPRLEERHRRAADPQILMISRRDPEVNRRKVAEAGLTFPVALQKNWDTSRDYGMFATPIGYLIDERGVIAADVATGSEAILALASPPGGSGRSSPSPSPSPRAAQPAAGRN